jgi:site-specific DNA-adenine methylase
VVTWFGGKSRVAHLVWERFGDVPNYVEPFFGSGAVLLGRPHAPRIETVNDKDGYVANFWRAVSTDPEEVARYADHPVNENDLHARHAWLVSQRDELVPRLEGDPEYYDARIAGWWVWGICCWIASPFCGKGPWKQNDGILERVDDGSGVRRQLPHLGDAGRGINRQLPHLGDAGKGIRQWLGGLADRLRGTRVCCGDWGRVTGPSVTTKHGITGVLLDPPYSAERDGNLYREESMDVAHDVAAWAIKNGDHHLMRIALCGYEGEHEMPKGWECISWKTKGGYGSLGNGQGRENSTRERFSPHCLSPGSLFTNVGFL